MTLVDRRRRIDGSYCTRHGRDKWEEHSQLEREAGRRRVESAGMSLIQKTHAGHLKHVQSLHRERAIVSRREPETGELLADFTLNDRPDVTDLRHYLGSVRSR